MYEILDLSALLRMHSKSFSFHYEEVSMNNTSSSDVFLCT